MNEEIQDQDVEVDLNEDAEVETIEPTETEEETQESESESNEEQQEDEPWQRIDEELAPVPARKHIREKQKLKGRISERDDEIARLKEKIEALEKNSITQTNQAKPIKRPNELDYDTDDDYQKALSDYENELVSSKFRELESKRQNEYAFKQYQEKFSKALEDHYDRASDLIEKSGISPDLYKSSDAAVRHAVNSIAPGRGDQIVDQIITNFGDGSEKVLFYIGRNQTALSQFKSLLVEDPSGIKASIFLGEQKERLTAPKKMKSRAPKPAPTANGDANMGSNERALQKKYKEAHKKGNSQLAWDYRRKARQSGIDTSKW